MLCKMNAIVVRYIIVPAIGAIAVRVVGSTPTQIATRIVSRYGWQMLSYGRDMIFGARGDGVRYDYIRSSIAAGRIVVPATGTFVVIDGSIVELTRVPHMIMDGRVYKSALGSVPQITDGQDGQTEANPDSSPESKPEDKLGDAWVLL
jgi:hypothetical protein